MRFGLFWRILCAYKFLCTAIPIRGRRQHRWFNRYLLVDVSIFPQKYNQAVTFEKDAASNFGHFDVFKTIGYY